jgi:hypothetical protein
MGRIGALALVIAIAFPNLLFIMPDDEVTAQPFSSTLVTIDGEIDLWGSSFYAGGTGFWNDPYIIESSDTAPLGLKVLNIPKYVVIRNMTFRSTTGHFALNISDVSVCKLDNITIKEHPHLIKATGATELWIVNSTLDDIPTSYDYKWNTYTSPLWIYTSNGVHLVNSSLTGISNVTWDTNYKTISGSEIEIENCAFDMGMVMIYAADGKYNIGNCSLQDNSTIELRDANPPASSFSARWNQFNNSVLMVGKVNGATISDNLFEGDFSRLYIGLSYPIMSDVVNNSFLRSGGISCYAGSHTTMNYYNIIGNNFSHCINGAITINRHNVDNVYFWKNLFLYNRNSDDVYDEPQVDVRNTAHSGYRSVYWSKGGIGNYWTDWTGPDDNNDGIVDIP